MYASDAFNNIRTPVFVTDNGTITETKTRTGRRKILLRLRSETRQVNKLRKLIEKLSSKKFIYS
jgi:hypothetical protein